MTLRIGGQPGRDHLRSEIVAVVRVATEDHGRQLSDDVLAEFQAQGPDAGFSIEDHPNLLAPTRRALFEKFSTEVLALDPGVTRHILKLYIA